MITLVLLQKHFPDIVAVANQGDNYYLIATTERRYYEVQHAMETKGLVCQGRAILIGSFNDRVNDWRYDFSLFGVTIKQGDLE